MTGLRIGMVDLDTSHPGSFLPILREMGHEVVAVFDSGTIYPEGYAAEFAEKHHINNVCTSLEEMIPLIDLAIIHSCNWDVHIERARPFIEANKAVLIDKPLAGSLQDLQQIVTWSKEGARLAGGSSLLYCREVMQWKEENNAADWVYGMVGCGVDEFNYGIHAYSMLSALVGPGIQSVRHLGQNVQDQYEVQWADGRRAVLSVGKNDKYLPFYATTVTRDQMSHIVVENRHLYRSILEHTLPYLAGEAPAPLSVEDWIEPELAAIAGYFSREQEGRVIQLKDISNESASYDGAHFAEGYRKQKLGL